MKATLSYDLPEERDEFLQNLRGPEWEAALWDLDQWLRSQIKYYCDEDDKRADALQEVRDELYHLKNDNYGLEWSA